MARLYVVMGVSGAGKSTVASALAEHFGFIYLDADDFHSEEAKAHMKAGKPLTDEMRVPWIGRICQRLSELEGQGKTAVLAFSGLKKRHREPLRQCGQTTHFLFLDGEAELIAQRLSARQGHFMAPSLLDSQFDSLERPDLTQEPDVHLLNIATEIPTVLERAITLVERLETEA